MAVDMVLLKILKVIQNILQQLVLVVVQVILEDQKKKKFFEVILLEKDYSKARLELDLAGIQLTKSLEAWLESYYQNLSR